MDTLLALDHSLFLLINRDWTSSWADVFFPAITDLHRIPWIAIPAIAGLLAFMIHRFGKKAGLLLFSWFVVTVGISDLFGARVVKPFFGRLRPDDAGVEAILRAAHHGGASFVSNHASNAFCATVFLSILFPRLTAPLLSLAFLVAYSRVYCGVHFPLDVIGGALQGSLIASLSVGILVKANIQNLGVSWRRFS